MKWFQRLFRGRELPPPAPSWAVELGEAVQKAARAQARVGARLESMESKLEGGFADLRVLLHESRTISTADTVAVLPCHELFDSADLLDGVAGQLARQGEAELSRGLIAVRERIETFLAAAGFERLAAPEHARDGSLFRVVAEADQPAEVRLVRAAIRRGGGIVREGEVIVKKKEAAGDDSVRD